MANRSQLSEEKNKKQEMLAEIRGAPTESTTGLREAAVRMNELVPLGRKGLDVNRLLRGLQEGRLRSGAFFPSQPTTWIDIRADYWLGVTTKKFECIRNSEDSGYMVRLRQFSVQFVDALIEKTARDDIEAFRAGCVYALQNSSKAVEVTLVLDKDWNAYLDTLSKEAMNDLSLTSRKAGRGRKEKEGWKTVASVLAAYLIAKNIRSRDQISQKKIAEEIWTMANQLNEAKVALPGADSIEDQVSQVFGLIKRFEKN